MDEAKDYGKGEVVILEKFSVWKSESEIMKEAISLECDGGEIHAFFTRDDKLYWEGKFYGKSKFGFLRDALKSDQILLLFVLFKGEKSCNEIKEACIEYVDKLLTMDGTVTKKRNKCAGFTVQSEPKDSRIEDPCKLVENFHLMMTKKPLPARRSEPVYLKCNKKGHYASQCRSRQEHTC